MDSKDRQDRKVCKNSEDSKDREDSKESEDRKDSKESEDRKDCKDSKELKDRKDRDRRSDRLDQSPTLHDFLYTIWIHSVGEILFIVGRMGALIWALKKCTTGPKGTSSFKKKKKLMFD